MRFSAVILSVSNWMLIREKNDLNSSHREK